MNNCIFCKIVNKTSPAHIVYEDDFFLVILSKFPLVEGHVLVLPKKHFDYVWDLDPELEAKQGVLVGKVARALSKHFQSKVRSFVSGEEIQHSHVWLFPALGDAGKPEINFRKTKSFDPCIMQQIADDITFAIKNSK